ncbi:MAG: Mur ligase family protein, partial [Actinomycetota bacterium]|nr:Mur ligase family protein [Actinomycetota bacterium]
MRLGDLLAAGAAVDPTAVSGGQADGLLEGARTVEVSGIAHDSRTVRPGDLFCCVPGAVHDGHDHAADAVAAGAVAVLAERPLAEIGLSSSGVPVVILPSVRRAMPLLAAAVHGHPSATLDVVGVTGTNGKTSVVHLLGAILDAAGRRAATWGTLSGGRTTPESTDLQATLADWVADGAEVAAIEVSSHALAQHRVDGTRFAAVAFTMLGRDHLDFHATMADYEAAKARLFDGTFSGRAVVSVGDEAGRRIAAVAEDCGLEVVAVDPTTCEVRPTATGTEMRWRDRSVA